MPKKLTPKKVPSVYIVRKLLSKQTRVDSGDLKPVPGRESAGRSLRAEVLPPQIPPESVAVSGVSRPAQSPPEVAPAIFAPGVIAAVVSMPINDEELSSAMRGEVNVATDNLSAWQEVVPRRLARSIRLSSQASPAMSGERTQRVLHLSDVNSPLSYSAVTSSISPVPSEASDSSELPTVLPVETILPSTPVVSNQLPLTEQLFVTEPASIAERILSSGGRLSYAQQAYVASAARLARMMSPAQLSARSELVGAERLIISLVEILIKLNFQYLSLLFLVMYRQRVPLLRLRN